MTSLCRFPGLSTDARLVQRFTHAGHTACACRVSKGRVARIAFINSGLFQA